MDQWKQTIWVMLPCTKEWIDEEKVLFLDISEDISGRDILTYICPECNKTHQSLRCSR